MILMSKYKKYIGLGMVVITLLIAYFAFCFYMRGVYSKQYKAGCDMMREKYYAEAREIFINLGDYKDSVSKAETAENHINYEKAKQLFSDGQYEEAWKIFDDLGSFEESEEKSKESRYAYAVDLYNSGDYNESSRIFLNLGDYKESKTYAAGTILTSFGEMQLAVYNKAVEYYNNGYYDYALVELRKLDESYKDVSTLIPKIEKLKSQRLANHSQTISAGVQYTIGIKSDNTVISTGYNENGQSNIEDWTDIVSIAGRGVVTIGLKADGTVITTPVLNTTGVHIDTSKWKNIIAVSAGERYVVGLTQEGEVLGEGHDAGDGQLAFDDNWKTGVVAIATGWRHTVALKADGEILITGYRSRNQLRAIEANKDEWTDIVAIAAGGGGDGATGRGHTVGLRRDGTVVAVGDNTYSQCEVSEWTDIVAIAAGDWHTVGLKADGTVVATGDDGTAFLNKDKDCCALEDWKNIVAISAGSGSTIGLTADGDVKTAGYDDSGKTTIAKKWHDMMVYEDWKDRIS